MKDTREYLENLMKQTGGSLYLSGTKITELPENLTVGGSLDLSGTQIKNSERGRIKILANGDYRPNTWLYCDDILTHVTGARKHGEYTFYKGKIKGKNVVQKGNLYAHCKTFKEGVADISFKEAKDRGAGQYKGFALDKVLAPEEAKTMYRIITGACQAGTESFVNSLGKLKKGYTVAEIIELTKGQYGADTFKRFFEA